MLTDHQAMTDETKIQTLELFPKLDRMLIELLDSLTEAEWNAPTVAKLWKVKDVASHLLDGNLRGLSISRDQYFGDQSNHIHSYQDLVSFLNQLNMTWTAATNRLSPRVLIELLAITGKQYTAHLQELDPFENAVFSVGWAGQETSSNWFHIAREYTEKFLHQQQIRDAVSKDGIMTKELFYPFLNTFMYALPYTFSNTEAAENTTVTVIVSTDIGGQWNITKTATEWVLSSGNNNQIPDSTVIIDPNTAWKLFSKSWNPEQAADTIEITGNKELGEQVLKMVSVMA
ncbi:maleylpyruvate isomerase N-terminal domain-containing protein [Niabella hibiscisoli]|uniref:maleylpyruvate isomerase N-terminal domain-containing protein n=1 Tax=Niabella hibiscisoli TaxID=1825928 RepID=UPI001F0FD815|nr:maleylpyruvate isomerase N-terminal domain-containing protein [Niabella hibiscisoli]MCH5717367.1 maleylpyruvate isomerase N-terminal domain-containing protein [Niabella hibiscisoli]